MQLLSKLASLAPRLLPCAVQLLNKLASLIILRDQTVSAPERVLMSAEIQTLERRWYSAYKR